MPVPSRRALLRLFGLAALGLSGCRSHTARVVLYCAQDRDFARAALEAFQTQTGLEVVPKFDTEANKSVGLYREIVAEKGRPRCDLFWNNEIVSTIRLHSQGLLQPHVSPAAESYPDWARADDHTWYAFAARARVLLVNTRLLAADDRPRSLLDLTAPRYRGRVVMARPQFGTTATQTACLFEVLGRDRAVAWLEGLRANDVQLAPGNKQAAEWVGRGQTPLGRPVVVAMTDTDDALIEVKAGRPVAIVFPDRDGGPERMGTLFIPNTLCIPADCPNPAGARRLLDYLLGPDVEAMLAEGPGAQIPLNPAVEAHLPAVILTPDQLTVMRVDWAKAAAVWDEAQRQATRIFTPG